MAEQIRTAFDNEETEADAVSSRNLLIFIEDWAEHLLWNTDPRVRDLDAQIVTPVATAD
jgi:hypothetical protein